MNKIEQIYIFNSNKIGILSVDNRFDDLLTKHFGFDITSKNHDAEMVKKFERWIKSQIKLTTENLSDKDVSILNKL